LHVFQLQGAVSEQIFHVKLLLRLASPITPPMMQPRT
jgi:hypothetical protein